MIEEITMTDSDHSMKWFYCNPSFVEEICSYSRYPNQVIFRGRELAAVDIKSLLSKGCVSSISIFNQRRYFSLDFPVLVVNQQFSLMEQWAKQYKNEDNLAKLITAHKTDASYSADEFRSCFEDSRNTPDRYISPALLSYWVTGMSDITQDLLTDTAVRPETPSQIIKTAMLLYYFGLKEHSDKLYRSTDAPHIGPFFHVDRARYVMATTGDTAEARRLIGSAECAVRGNPMSEGGIPSLSLIWKQICGDSSRAMECLNNALKTMSPTATIDWISRAEYWALVFDSEVDAHACLKKGEDIAQDESDWRLLKSAHESLISSSAASNPYANGMPFLKKAKIYARTKII